MSDEKNKAVSAFAEVTTGIANNAAKLPQDPSAKPQAVEPTDEIASATKQGAPLPRANPAEDYGPNPQTLRELGEIVEPKAPS
jgi:hypothetical protein